MFCPRGPFDVSDHFDLSELMALRMFGPLGPTLIDHSDLYLDSIHDSGSKTRVAILAGKASPPSSRLFCRAVGTWGGLNPIPARGQIILIMLLIFPHPSGFADLPTALNLERVDCRHCIDGF